MIKKIFSQKAAQAFVFNSLLVSVVYIIIRMKDLIVDSAGALMMSVVGYISLKYKKGWLSDFVIKRECVELAPQVIVQDLEQAA